MVMRLRKSRNVSAAQLAAGALLLGSMVPWFVWFGWAQPGWSVVAIFSSLLQSVGGLILTVRGAAGVRTTSRRLAATKQLMQLPAARVASR